MSSCHIHTLVHCHIGSLETAPFEPKHGEIVHCHIGSLEMYAFNWNIALTVHCHIGSLEMSIILNVLAF